MGKLDARLIKRRPMFRAGISEIGAVKCLVARGLASPLSIAAQSEESKSKCESSGDHP